jgi:cation:H+ antiporter
VATLALITRAPLANVSIHYVSLSSLVLLACYLMGMRATFRYQRRELADYLARHPEEVKEILYPDHQLGEAAARFGLHALVVVAAGFWLPRVAEQLAFSMGWHLTLMGTVFLALVTTLPEVVVTISALRLGAVDLAVGDLLGSLMANTAMLGLLDFFYFDGPLLRAAAPEHASTGILAIIMVGIAVAELIYRPQKKALRRMSLGAFLLAFLYAGNIILQIMSR